MTALFAESKCPFCFLIVFYSNAKLIQAVLIFGNLSKHHWDDSER